MGIKDVFVGAFADELEKLAETETSTIGGERITEKKGKLTEDLGKPPSEASESELESYVKGGSTPEERQKRMARVNLFRAHMKGVKAQTGTKPHSPKVEPGKGSIEKKGSVRSFTKKLLQAPLRKRERERLLREFRPRK